MADFLAMEDGREHRQHRFYQHPRVPGATRTDFHINGIPALGMETHIGQDNHLRIKLRNQGLKMSFVCLASECATKKAHEDLPTGWRLSVCTSVSASTVQLGQDRLSEVLARTVR